MNDVLDKYDNSVMHNNLINDIKEKIHPIEILGSNSYSDINLLKYIISNINEQIVYIVPNELKAQELYNSLKDEKNVLYIPKKEVILYDYIADSKNIPYERADSLNKLNDSKKAFIIVSIETLMQKMIPKQLYYGEVLNLKSSSTIDMQSLKNSIAKMGYQKCELIESRGQFCVRGDIIDIGISSKKAIRIELWGDDIDSIREFDIQTQRSTKQLSSVKIYPNHEYLLENDISNTVNEIKQYYSALKLKDKKQEDIVKNDIEQILSKNYVSKIDKYIDRFYKKPRYLNQYFSKNAYYFFDDYTKILNRQKTLLKDNILIGESLIEKSKIIPEILEYQSSEQLENNFKNVPKVFIQRDDNYLANISNFKLENIKSYEFNIKPKTYRKDELSTLILDIKNYLNEYNIIALANKDQTKQAIKILEDYDIAYIKKDKFIQTKNSMQYVTLLDGDEQSGFIDEDTKTILIDLNIFLQSANKKKRKSKTFESSQKVVYADLKVGDVVVHENHGIGIYIGVNRISIGNVTKDYIKLRYRDNDILYVPTSQMDRVRKYIGDNPQNVKLSSLSSKDWEKTKQRVKNNLRLIAKDLLELYARREKSKGFAFSKDTPWQREFEDKFEFEETDDQIRCIEEIKSDMEDQKPMDRLLCGDVGFGKTEVALRAMFKAVCDSKQVAYVAPTTVLANQQYLGIKERFKDFPVKIELLNRYKTKKEQEQVVKKLKTGEVDIVIGTHRLFSKDIDFYDLGLLVIDEEQRFGVKQKEKIKNLKNNIDVLTMSATPIPRTLHMSIAGIRDMSVIYTPPQDRKPVQTYVMEYDEDIIKEAMTKELERQGQVFYLFNRVDKMERKLSEIQNMMPNARVEFANGKMTGKQIEDIMNRFVNKEIDILLCTTILEAGIDIPNANTLIIENADKMGLSQLYQIRGRVGRSSRQAYSYITYKKEKIISEDADKRLKALKEFTEFGSGYKIAMRDLEIRGAGSLVGELQSGHLEEVGYDTYMKLLNEVIKEIKQEKVIDDSYDVNIDVDISAYIPDEFISNEEQKIDIYQKIAQNKSEEDVLNITDELIDRYGQIPQQVLNLIEISKVRYLSQMLNITKVIIKNGFMILNFKKDCFLFDLNYINKKFGNKMKFSNTTIPKITISLDNDKGIKMLKQAIDILIDLEVNYNFGSGSNGSNKK